MKPKIIERSRSSTGIPVAKVECESCKGRGFHWEYDYGTDPWVEWRLLWRRVLAILGRKS